MKRDREKERLVFRVTVKNLFPLGEVFPDHVELGHRIGAPVGWGYLPVNMVARLGLHDEVVTSAPMNLMPRAASRSTLAC